MLIRAYAATDAAAVRGVLLDAFGDEGPKVAGLVEDLRETHAHTELVAQLDGAVIGHVLLSRSWVDARQELVEVLVLSPLSVAVEHQGQRVGTRLLEVAVGEAARVGTPAVFLEGDPGYYSAHGFEPAVPRGFSRPSPRIPAPAFQVVVLAAHEEWMTGPLVYCEPFWSHDCVGLRDPDLASLEQVFDA